MISATSLLRPRGLRRGFGVLLLVLSLPVIISFAPLDTRQIAANGTKVDLALVLAVDCSSSVNAAEFRLQMDGMALAFSTPEIQRAIANGPNGAIAVSLVFWGKEGMQEMAISWRRISTAKTAFDLAAEMQTTPRTMVGHSTAVGSAMLFSGATLLSAPVITNRLVMDISSDGRNNTGPKPERIRDLLISKGITINGLVIMTDDLDLDYYYERYVIGGSDSFVVKANDYAAYGKAIYRKLMREITGRSLS